MQTLLKSSVVPAAATLTLLVLLAGCGQKGPLYLSDKPPANVKPPKPEPFKPLPYPKQTGEDESPGGGK